MKKTFCPECRTDAEYSIERKLVTSSLKNQQIQYYGEVAYCGNCGSEIWLPEFHDSNLRVLYKEYKERNDLISTEMILDILEIYCIGKRPLSLLLGWGELTVSRYVDGHIPSKQYSDELMKIYNDPEYYYFLLEQNKSNLTSQLTYNKSRQATLELIGQRDDSSPIIDSIVRYVLNKGEDITPMTLQKALYYIQGFYYAFYEDYLIVDDCEAWTHGPVYRNIYNRYSDYNYGKIEKPAFIDDSSFTNMEKGLIECVVKYICCYSGKILEGFTHQEAPWLLARIGLPAREASNRIISKGEIGAYFSGIKERYNMCTPTDIQLYAVEMFGRVNG